MSDILKKLKESNYVRKALPKNSYWVDFSKSKLEKNYIEKCGDNFCIIIYSKLGDDDSDFYAIPYSVIKPLLQERYLSNNSKMKPKRRWIATIENHFFKVTNCPEIICVKDFYHNLFQINNYALDSNNNHSIENMKQEINVRMKQSIFRNNVLSNFHDTCCISGITEKDLLVASHIIPWAHNIEFRLDPLNGLCLSVLYDKLFDKGYFTLTNDMKVIVTNNRTDLSETLREILELIEGKEISSPHSPIKNEYLEYHREKIFVDKKK